ncbi:MAG TPA: TrkA C-terminal domain-containing protein [Leptospiraceae bacterium]|nr:TrkA C-terminal domain-containing protein [Leptospiraceae bacterium]HNF16429.1 TrkA C-terminal domain-containing protein [Leptospiraceae bacterium]HNF26987.1 TrkA C-terminal domain-containing protein [Leptospiraceae bacterium]HNO22081.1 TrkA C-terminal domain-containing protein [Leptospiraceae bacterium]
MEKLIHFLEENKPVLLFIVIAAGYFIGRIKVKGFSLGIAAVLFVGLAFGSLSSKLSLPDIVYILGLVIFVYTTGLQSGPGFFAGFNRQGIAVNLTMISVLSFTAVLTVILGKTYSLNENIVSGLYTGSLTNTPALASVVDTLKNSIGSLPANQTDAVLGEPIAGYSIAYPYGVLGVILFFFLFRKIFKINMEKESSEAAEELGLGTKALEHRDILVTNLKIIGKKVADIFKENDLSGIVIARIRKSEETDIATGETVLEKNDIITLVGTKLREKTAFFGVHDHTHLYDDRSDLDFRRIFVSNPDVIGLTIKKLDLHSRFQATITRVKRGDTEFVPSNDTVLEGGDRIRVVAAKEDMEKVSAYFGDSFHSLSEIDYISMSIGIAIGLVLGEIPIPIFGGASFRLGYAGGPLIVALVLGYIGRTGNLIWGMSYNANLTLRQTGVVLFLAGIGLKAGFSFGVNFSRYGLLLVSLGFILTSLNTGLMMLAGRYFLKIPFPLLLGIVSGMQTQPACIAYANAEAKNSVPNYGYSLVFPAAMITKIILVQIIFNVMKV